MKKLFMLGLACGLGSVGYGQNLVVNPGFETGDFTGWSIQDASTDSLVFVDGPAGGYNAHSGSYAAQFGAYDNIDDVIYQTLSTVAGDSYTFSLWVDSGGTPEDLNIYWNTSNFTGTGNVYSSTSLNDGTWTLYSFTEVASTTSTVIGIGAFEDPAYTAVDDVSVVQVSPEPASMAFLGFGALALIRRRRSRG